MVKKKWFLAFLWGKWQINHTNTYWHTQLNITYSFPYCTTRYLLSIYSVKEWHFYRNFAVFKIQFKHFKHHKQSFPLYSSRCRNLNHLKTGTNKTKTLCIVRHHYRKEREKKTTCKLGERSKRDRLTLKAPRRKRVGSRPTEKMRRRIVTMTRARMPSGWGMMITMTSVAKTPIHSRADRWGSSIPAEDECTHTRQPTVLMHRKAMKDIC